MICLKARAKINLMLEIGERRPDGFHELETVFQTIDLSDELAFEAADEFRIQSDDPDLPTDRRNLIWRAAEALQAETGVKKGFSVFVKKRIPAGAGLGGGSSDAAATLVALDELWETNLSPETLAKLALALGSDVPFFLFGGTALGKGRGEDLERLPSVELPLVIALPEARVSTPWAYAKVDDLPNRQHHSSKPLVDALKRGNRELVALALANSFEEALFPEFPAMADLKIKLLIHGAIGSCLSGSGSAIFGIFRDQATADRAAAALQREGFAAFSTKTADQAIIPC